jgi:hypothetical protein
LAAAAALTPEPVAWPAAARTAGGAAAATRFLPSAVSPARPLVKSDLKAALWLSISSCRGGLRGGGKERGGRRGARAS